MSHNNSILDLLNLKDKNIFLKENYLEKKIIKGVEANVIHATLTYKPAHCESCGSYGSHIIKYGFKSSNILLLNVVGYKTYLCLKKQKFLCNCCNKTFLATTNIVKKHCFISKQTKLSIALTLKNNFSEKAISELHNVSHNTVNRIALSFYKEYTPKKNYLPYALNFDEFKSVKNSSGAMSFIFMDATTGKIMDVLEDRRLFKLKEYFSRYTIEARMAVRHIVIDMYSPYISLIKEMFPNAKISIDRFHLVQLINRSFNKTRITLMKKYHKSDRPFYNKLKRYWKLLLKKSTELGILREHYHHSFKRYISETEIIDYLLNKDIELSEAYNIYQNLAYAINEKNHSLFSKYLKESFNTSNTFILTSLRTFKEYLPFIENSLNYAYSNGTLEGTNNRIKVLKRNAYGFRSFVNLRNRILISSNLLNLKAAS